MTVDGDFEIFAKKICDYAMKKYVLPWMREHGVVQTYRATVISKNTAAKTMEIQRPYDNTITVPYASSAASIEAGDFCTVFILGEASNAVVVADGQMNMV